MKKALTLVCLLGLALSISAQNNISFDQVRYWVGTGTDSALVIVNFATEDDVNGDDLGYYKTALVYGVRWNGTAVTRDLMDTITKNDYRMRFEYSQSGSFFNAASFSDTAADFELEDSEMEAWMYTDNGDTVEAINLHNVDNGHTLFLADMGYFHAIDTIIYVEAPAPAPSEFVLTAYDIPYWVGTGSNSAVIAINWLDTALAWGYNWNGTATVQQALDAIVAADGRVIVVPGGYGIDDIMFVRAAGDTLKGSSWWGSTNNGVMDAGMYQNLSNGDFEKWADGLTGVYTGTAWDVAYGGYQNDFYVYPDFVQPVDLPANLVPEEATIDTADILYWVGTGSNKVIMAVNWADTALAWGFRFSEASVTVMQVMDSIAAADPRFSYVMSGQYLGDILFIDTAAGMTDTLRTGSWWGSTLNGVMDAGMYQTLSDGDFEKWADPSTGVFVRNRWTEYYGYGYWNQIYVYPMTVYPVSVPSHNNGISPVVASALKVYPNPAVSVVNVKFAAVSRDTEAVVYDMTGRKVYSKAIAAGSESVQISVDALPAGVYMMNIGGNMAKIAVCR